MIDKIQAFELAEKYINNRKGAYDIIIDRSNIYEEDFGWVFSFNLRPILEGKSVNFNERISGFVPIIVNKKTGEIVETGSRLNAEQYIALYKKVKGDKDEFYKIA